MAKKPGLKMLTALAVSAPSAQQKFMSGAPAAAADEKRERGKMVRINFEIEPELHQRLKIHATVKGTSIRDLLLTLIEKELSQ